MGKHRTEQNFERRMQRILTSKGYLVINCARSKPFDLVAVKDQYAYLIELKGKTTRYPETQLNQQIQLCKKTGNEFVVIKQSRKKGKIKVFQPFSFSLTEKLLENDLKQDLAELLENEKPENNRSN